MVEFLPGLQMSVVLRVGRGWMWVVVAGFTRRPGLHHGCRGRMLTVHHISHSGRVGAWIPTWACKIGPYWFPNSSKWRKREKEKMLIYRASKKKLDCFFFNLQKLNDNLRSVAGRQTERRFCVGVFSFFEVSSRDSKKHKHKREEERGIIIVGSSINNILWIKSH